MVLRPEDLTRVETSRLSVTQTLGGAWADDWGPGIATIQISGHTGWRGGRGADGITSFMNLRDIVFVEWHRLRLQAKNAGQDPGVIKLIYSDALDNIVNVVAPGAMTLKRNKSRPLLMMYQIPLTVISDRLDDATKDAIGLSDSADSLGLDSLEDSLRTLEEYAANVRDFIDANLIGPVTDFMNLANTAIERAMDAISRAKGVVSAQENQFIAFASDIAAVGRNAFNMYNAAANFPDFVKFQISEVASAYGNVFCVFQNVFRRTRLYPDYSDVYGSSNCSSTSGGSPLSPFRFDNTFDMITRDFSSPISVSSSASLDISWLKSSDPVLMPASLSDIGARMKSIGSGVSFS